MSNIGVIRAEDFHAPGPVDFFLPDFLGHDWNESGYQAVVTKAGVLLILGAVLAFAFLRYTSSKQQVVPSKGQFLGEQAYDFVRNGIARDIIGEKDFMRYVPLLVSVFFFVLINNLFGIVPVLSFSTFSRASYAYGLAAMVWIIYNAVGVIDKGPIGYLKHTTVPSGVPAWILPLLIPLEFLSNIIIRPVTLSLRLFANMFAGHLLIDAVLHRWSVPSASTATGTRLHRGQTRRHPVLRARYRRWVSSKSSSPILQAYVFTLLTALSIFPDLSLTEH